MSVAPTPCMQRLLSNHVGMVKLFGSALIVFFAGSALTTTVVSRLLLDVGEATTASEDAAEGEGEGEGDEEDAAAKTLASARANATLGLASKAPRKEAAAETITNANLFCPTCVPVEVSETVLASAGPSASFGETRSSLRLQLLATMESDDPTLSMATIRDLDSNSLGPYTANEQLRAGVTLLAVERGRVVVLNQGRREYITLGDEPAPAPAPAAAKPTTTAKPTASKGKSVAIEGAEDAIDCSNENACVVERKFVDQLLANPTQLMTQARMAPISRDGEHAGFRVSRIRSGSLATLIGLENGDVISEINGQKLGSIDEALGMYQKLRRASHLSVVVERGGAVITKEISIK
ncbi:hypothetical protein G6O69_33995 [Pseudenhygromyxa sp. WMMC2535]|uniref:type II secretion system protein GspC n=1 Tax=Pseudenhygromyxa sp. WMMC2535 TaxID=2712867 RepID=UPI00159564D3|nr:type II secretion system protein GspC [Pseudenhygromyxa sp. WMMC2535]NVB42883.1 hypothetical protein [Pseudenhygromyxa sp. WMMC2535]